MIIIIIIICRDDFLEGYFLEGTSLFFEFLFSAVLLVVKQISKIVRGFMMFYGVFYPVFTGF